MISLAGVGGVRCGVESICARRDSCANSGLPSQCLKDSHLPILLTETLDSFPETRRIFFSFFGSSLTLAQVRNWGHIIEEQLLLSTYCVLFSMSGWGMPWGLGWLTMDEWSVRNERDSGKGRRTFLLRWKPVLVIWTEDRVGRRVWILEAPKVRLGIREVGTRLSAKGFLCVYYFFKKLLAAVR
jgi:hypothetical protein